MDIKNNEQNPSKTDIDLGTLLERREKLQAELVALEKQISDLQNQRGKPSAPVEQVVEETQQAIQNPEIAFLKNQIELCKSNIKFYTREKEKNEHHLRRGIRDGDFKENSDDAKYFRERIENADRMIVAHQEQLGELDEQLAKLE